MLRGWEDKIDNGGKPLGKNVHRSLEEVCKTAKGLHKHFKVIMLVWNYVCVLFKCEQNI